MVQFFSGGKKLIYQSGVLRFFFYMTKYKDVIIIEKKMERKTEAHLSPNQ